MFNFEQQPGKIEGNGFDAAISELSEQMKQLPAEGRAQYRNMAEALNKFLFDSQE
jgi:hypothetical protein